jgi:hypothetical protein
VTFKGNNTGLDRRRCSRTGTTDPSYRSCSAIAWPIPPEIGDAELERLARGVAHVESISAACLLGPRTICPAVDSMGTAKELKL